ncbi:MAG: hypothetical protein ACI3ZT_01705 [Candidatus Cryptobacteroides sp.]
MKIKNLLALAVCCAVSAAASAQAPQAKAGGPERGNREERTPEAIARQKVNRMDSRLGLSDKQEKQLYNFFYKQEKSLQKTASGEQRPGGEGLRPPQGGMGGGRSQMGGGHPSGGHPMGGRPQMGDRPQGERPQGDRAQGERPDRGSFQPGEMPANYDKIVENEAKTDKKLKKVLTSDQYSSWQSLNEMKKKR